MGSSSRFVHTSRPDASQEGELIALANAYSYILRCVEDKKKATGAGHTSDDDAKEGTLDDSRDTNILPE